MRWITSCEWNLLWPYSVFRGIFEASIVTPSAVSAWLALNPFIPGRPAEQEEIETLLLRVGFIPAAPSWPHTWIHHDLRLLVSDTYPDNFVVMQDGSIIPIAQFGERSDAKGESGFPSTNL